MPIPLCSSPSSTTDSPDSGHLCLALCPGGLLQRPPHPSGPASDVSSSGKLSQPTRVGSSTLACVPDPGVPPGSKPLGDDSTVSAAFIPLFPRPGRGGSGHLSLLTLISADPSNFRSSLWPDTPLSEPPSPVPPGSASWVLTFLWPLPLLTCPQPRLVWPRPPRLRPHLASAELL